MFLLTGKIKMLSRPFLLSVIEVLLFLYFVGFGFKMAAYLCMFPGGRVYFNMGVVRRLKAFVT